jgi:hypothetical protein
MAARTIARLSEVAAKKYILSLSIVYVTDWKLVQYMMLLT